MSKHTEMNIQNMNAKSVCTGNWN